MENYPRRRPCALGMSAFGATLLPSTTFPIMRTLFAALFLILTASPLALAQSSVWTDVSETAIRSVNERNIVPEAYRTVRLDRAALATVLADAPLEVRPGDVTGGAALDLPMPDGSTETFRVIESPIMAPGLQARYPQIRTYLGQSIDNPATAIRFSVTPHGFNALVFRPEGSVYVDPYQRGDLDHYIAYNRADHTPDVERVRAAFAAEEVVGISEAEPVDLGAALRTHGDILRTYRLALAATGEYTARVSSIAGVDTTVASGLAAQVIAMNRVNGIYEREVAVRMEIVENNDEIVYTDGNTDPYTNGSGGTLLGQNQANLAAVIGLDNFDIGHVFSTGGGGVAGLGVVCNDSQKARGVTGLPNPNGDPFYVDYVAHEMGHQFRGNHTFNGSAGACTGGNRNAGTAYEPGSGSTIMAYAGICFPQNIQNRSDDYFHVISLLEITSFITNPITGGSCAVETETGNEPPVVTALGGFAIPVETPFVLVGEATDDTPESLTYNWEEYERGNPASAPPGVAGWNEDNPFFRSFPATSQPVRYFPQFSRLLLGLSPVVGERLPLDDQRLRFRLTARDNAPGGGGIDDLEIEVNAYAEAGPFVVTFANENNVVIAAGPNEITWDVAGTDGGEVNTPEVNILYSADGGDSFELLMTTDNDGAETVFIPVGDTDEARIIVQGSDNIFFDVNDEDFEVKGTGVANETQPEIAYALSPVWPNPVGAGTGRATLNLSVAQGQAVRVAVYDVLGREAAVLHDGPLPAAQNRQFVLEASSLAAGVYFVRATGETFSDVREMTVVR